MRISKSRTTDCQREVYMSASVHNLLMTSRGRFRLVAIVLVVMASIAGFGRVYGRLIAAGAMQERNRAVNQLEIQAQRLELERTDQDIQVSALQSQIEDLQAHLNAIMPSKNMYSINPNQSLLVADGHLAIGLVGGPLSNGINTLLSQR